MTRILIQPCASREARKNWDKTMSQEITYTSDKYAGALTAEQRDALQRVHRSDSVHFWGSTAFHDRAMQTVTTGDVALFAWNNRIRAIGEVGWSFRNPAFAELLWKEPDSADTFVNVYSLLSYSPSDFGYDEMPENLRPPAGQGFRPGRVIDNPDDVANVLDALKIVTVTEEAQDRAAEEKHLGDLVERSVEKALEKRREEYQRRPNGLGMITVGNTESLLVHEYVASDSGHTYQRFSCSAGTTDLHTREDGQVNLYEAKGGSSTKRVREAVAQLLHYAPMSPDPVGRLTALFPEEPAPMDVAYLHRLGIDCVFRVGPNEFVRSEATVERRHHMRLVWNDKQT